MRDNEAVAAPIEMRLDKDQLRVLVAAVMQAGYRADGFPISEPDDCDNAIEAADALLEAFARLRKQNNTKRLAEGAEAMEGEYEADGELRMSIGCIDPDGVQH